MRRLTSALTCLCLIASLAGCGTVPVPPPPETITHTVTKTRDIPAELLVVPTGADWNVSTLTYRQLAENAREDKAALGSCVVEILGIQKLQQIPVPDTTEIALEHPP